MDIIQAIILAIIEGLTEYLPVSSTGHMIIGAALMGIEKNAFTKVFIVAIQLGAILAVVSIYYKKFFQDIRFYLILLVGFIPAVVGGLFLKKEIDKLLENVEVVAISLIAGGVILLFVDKWFKDEDAVVKDMDNVSYWEAFKIGCFQVIAMIPGVSRSGATIIGGLTQKLDKKTAAEFSFLLAVPTMFAATAKSLWDDKEVLLQQSDKIGLLVIGNAVAFVVGFVAVKYFIQMITRYGFRFFGYYRIVVGVILLVCIYSGVTLQIVD